MSATVFIVRDFVMDTLLDDVADRLAARGIRVVRGPESRPGQITTFPEEKWDEWFAHTDVAMFSSRNRCSKAMLEHARRLRGIVNPTIGLETVDLEAADALGIIVGHGATPENFIGMAEATVMLILMGLYRPQWTSDVLHGRRHRPKPHPETAWARLLSGRTVGLVGFGRIARAVAERLRTWDVHLLTADPHVDRATVPEHVTLTDLDTLLAQSDVVSIHVAVTAASRGLIDARALSLMKRDAYLVNTSRGDAVDEVALASALADGRIAGASLDVFQVEPLPAASPLRELENAFLTPHMVGQTREVYASIAPAAEQNILRVLAGELPLYCKNPGIEARWRARLGTLAS